VKAQPIRLLDVFVLGPMMLWAGYLLRSRPIGPIMTVTGICTIGYNWENYQRVRLAEKD
jgi:hypothetical protein